MVERSQQEERERQTNMLRRERLKSAGCDWVIDHRSVGTGSSSRAQKDVTKGRDIRFASWVSETYCYTLALSGKLQEIGAPTNFLLETDI